jgi:hypothetical protein
MNLERASERAHIARGRKSAARLYNDIEYELALGEPDDRLESAGEQALALLEDRFPGVQEAARQIEEPPSLSRRAVDALHGVTQRTPQPQPTARQCKSEEVALSLRTRLNAYRHAHPARAVVITIFFIIVVVKLWACIVVAVIALAAIKTYRHN